MLTPEAARERMRQDIGGKVVVKMAADSTVPTEKFIWHAVSRAMGNTIYQGKN